MTLRTSNSIRILIIPAFVAVLALTACGSSSQPKVEQSASAAVSASPAVTATPIPLAAYKPADAKGKAENVPVPVLPDAAKANSKEGVEAFAKHWYNLLNYGFETGELGPIKAVTGPSCAMCGKVYPGIERWNSDGRWIVGSQILVQAASSKFVPTVGGEYQIVVQAQQSSGILLNADGSVGQAVSASGVIGDLMIAKYTDGKWFASNVDRLGN